jgi:hypothetical protein
MPFKVSISEELLINRELCQQTSSILSFRRLSLKNSIPERILNTFYPTAIILCSYIYRIHYTVLLYNGEFCDVAALHHKTVFANSTNVSYNDLDSLLFYDKI